MTNCHTWRNSMWINNQIRDNTFSCKWKIFLSICHSTCSFLSMPRGKFITNLRNFNSSHFYFYEKIIILLISHHYRINFSCFRMSKCSWAIFKHFFNYDSFAILKILIFWLNNFSNNNIITCYLTAWFNQTILIEFKIWSML